LLFVPPDQTLNLADVFVEDTLTLTDRLKLILGMKEEDDPWSGWSALPMARISWSLTDDTLLWAHVGRAIRAPTPFDTEVEEKEGSSIILTGNPNFLPEELTSYEVGYRGDLSDRLSLSATGYYDAYDHLKSLNFGTTYPLEWGNNMAGNVYGVEAWGNYQALDWWRLSAGVNIEREALHLEPGAIPFLGGIPQAGDDPHHQASLRSSMDLSDALTFDADFRYVGALPNPRLPQYAELNSRLGWKISEHVEVSLSGFNLLQPQHVEFPGGDEIKRSFFLDTRWRF
jgi:iron complex outermembrane receptor protein